MQRKTFLVDGRGVDVDSIDFESVDASLEGESYYEVSGAGIKPVLQYCAPPNMHLKVLEHALDKWYEMGHINEVTMNAHLSEL